MCAAAIQSGGVDFSFAPDGRPANIPDPEEVISGQQRLHILTEDAFRPAKAKDLHICREILMTHTASLAGGGFSNVRTLKANGAPPEAFRGLSEEHFGLIVGDADISLKSPEGRLSEGPE